VQEVHRHAAAWGAAAADAAEQLLHRDRWQVVDQALCKQRQGSRGGTQCETRYLEGAICCIRLEVVPAYSSDVVDAVGSGDGTASSSQDRRAVHHRYWLGWCSLNQHYWVHNTRGYITSDCSSLAECQQALAHCASKQSALHHL
jgi:hypothetical protein